MAKKGIPEESDEIDIDELMEEEVEEEVEEAPKAKAKPKKKSKAKPKAKPKAKAKPEIVELEDPMIVKKRVKRYIRTRENPMMVSKTIYSKLNDKLIAIVEEGCKRAEANKRKTLHAKDI